VELRSGLSYAELRELYQRARVVAVPVMRGVDYAAGVNGVLEAMASARALVASDTPGLAGYVRDGEDGRVVRAGDARALRAMLEELWEDRAQSERLGAAGRVSVERERTIDHFAATVADLVGACQM
jgi:glycosyltransferase involved in cell wall biosynthesis